MDKVIDICRHCGKEFDELELDDHERECPEYSPSEAELDAYNNRGGWSPSVSDLILDDLRMER